MTSCQNGIWSHGMSSKAKGLASSKSSSCCSMEGSSSSHPALAGWYTATAIPVLVVCHDCTLMKPGGLKGSSSSSGGSQQSRPQGSSPPSGGACAARAAWAKAWSCYHIASGYALSLPLHWHPCFYCDNGRRTVHLRAPTQSIGARRDETAQSSSPRRRPRCISSRPSRARRTYGAVPAPWWRATRR